MKSGWLASSGWIGLDRDLAAHLRLHRPVHDTEGALADLLQQPVAAEGFTLELQVGILPEDLFVQTRWISAKGRSPSSSARTARARW